MVSTAQKVLKKQLIMGLQEPDFHYKCSGGKYHNGDIILFDSIKISFETVLKKVEEGAIDFLSRQSKKYCGELFIEIDTVLIFKKYKWIKTEEPVWVWVECDGEGNINESLVASPVFGFHKAPNSKIILPFAEMLKLQESFNQAFVKSPFVSQKEQEIAPVDQLIRGLQTKLVCSNLATSSIFVEGDVLLLGTDTFRFSEILDRISQEEIWWHDMLGKEGSIEIVFYTGNYEEGFGDTYFNISFDSNGNLISGIEMVPKVVDEWIGLIFPTGKMYALQKAVNIAVKKNPPPVEWEY